MIVAEEAIVTANVALGAGGATIASSPVPTAAGQGINGVAAIARVHIPQISGIPGTGTCTIQILRGDTGAVIGQGTLTNPSGSSSTMGPGVAVAIIPPGVNTVSVFASNSSGAGGMAVASAAAPILLEIDLNTVA
jgi:hypothetical protein